MKTTERRGAHPATDEGEALLWVLGELVAVRARDEAYTLLESTAPPGGGLPPHVHRAQDEAIYILEGEYTLVVSGDRELRLGPGSFASFPRGTVHALKVAGDGPGRSLAILTPPEPVERFFEEIGVPVADRSTPFAPPEDPPGIEEVLASARRNGIHLLLTPV